MWYAKNSLKFKILCLYDFKELRNFKMEFQICDFIERYHNNELII